MSSKNALRKVGFGVVVLLVFGCTPNYEDPHPLLRVAAVEKLKNQRILAELAQSDPDSDVRRAATQKVTDQEILKQILETDPESRVCEAAVRRITDTKYLLSVAQGHHPPGAPLETVVRQCALYAIANKFGDAFHPSSVVTFHLENRDENLAGLGIGHYQPSQPSATNLQRVQLERLAKSAPLEATRKKANAIILRKIEFFTPADLDRLIELGFESEHGHWVAKRLAQLYDEGELEQHDSELSKIAFNLIESFPRFYDVKTPDGKYYNKRDVHWYLWVGKTLQLVGALQQPELKTILGQSRLEFAYEKTSIERQGNLGHEVGEIITLTVHAEKAETSFSRRWESVFGKLGPGGGIPVRAKYRPNDLLIDIFQTFSQDTVVDLRSS